MNYRKYLATAFLAPLLSHWALAQPVGEAAEPTPEELDAAFTAADAAREAAAWSDVIIERPVADPLADMSAAADLVIRGTVTAQRVAYGPGDTPYTHTTLSINEVMKGNYAGSEVTVVQEGGPTKNKPENVLMLSHTHYFNVGNEELLFLQLDPDNPYQDRRVVVKKRFGVHNGKLFDENGRGLIYNETDEAPGYRLSWSGNRNPHPRFSEFSIGPHRFSKQFEHEGQDMDSSDQSPATSQRAAEPGYQAGVDFNTFKNALSR